MSTKTPVHTSGWQLHGTGPGDGSSALEWSSDLELRQLETGDVLVEFRAWALNYPDVSNGAGVIVAVGSDVRRFRISDKVIPLYYPTFHVGNAPSLEQMSFTPGSSPSAPGTFRKMGVFKQEHVIAMPSNLDFDQAATLPCSALTAWNALHGIAPLKAGECVLVQGTGGVSLFAALFALAAGAIVIATTSTEEKANRLRELGVHHVLNYKENPEWGARAKELSPSARGCHRVIEVGGQQTIAQSFQCVARGGEIDIIGFLTGQKKDDAGLTYLEPLLRACTVRGIEVGNRVQFEEMVRAIEEHDIRPVIDGKRFALTELQEAYQFMWSQAQIGKIVLTTSNSV